MHNNSLDPVNEFRLTFCSTSRSLVENELVLDSRYCFSQSGASIRIPALINRLEEATVVPNYD
jgi:hypothetical protein